MWNHCQKVNRLGQQHYFNEVKGQRLSNMRLSKFDSLVLVDCKRALQLYLCAGGALLFFVVFLLGSFMFGFKFHKLRQTYMCLLFIFISFLLQLLVSFPCCLSPSLPSSLLLSNCRSSLASAAAPLRSTVLMFVSLCLCLSLTPLPPPLWTNKQREEKGQKYQKTKTIKSSRFPSLAFSLSFFRPLLASVRSLWDLLYSLYGGQKAKWSPIISFPFFFIFLSFIFFSSAAFIYSYIVTYSHSAFIFL